MSTYVHLTYDELVAAARAVNAFQPYRNRRTLMTAATVRNVPVPRCRLALRYAVRYCINHNRPLTERKPYEVALRKLTKGGTYGSH